MLDRNPGQVDGRPQERAAQDLGLADHVGALPRRGEIRRRRRGRATASRRCSAAGEKVGGHAIADLVTVNGVRVVTDDGTWGLVRASSNKPELVVVVESPVSEARMREMFAAVDGVLRAATVGRRLQSERSSQSDAATSGPCVPARRIVRRPRCRSRAATSAGLAGCLALRRDGPGRTRPTVGAVDEREGRGLRRFQRARLSPC